MIKKCLYSSMFWIGVSVLMLLDIIIDFINGENGLVYTVIWGSLYILLIAANAKSFERKGK